MGRKKNRKPLLENVEFFDLADKGKAVGRAEEQIVFVSGPIPGDVADVQVFKKSKSFMEGFVTEYKKRSDDLIDAYCEHFGVCGGCKWQHMSYETELFYKNKRAVDAITRIGKVEVADWKPIFAAPNTVNYRNKLEFTFSDKRWLTPDEIQNKDEIENKNGLGFHLPGKFDKVVQIEKCHLQADFTNQLRNFIYNYALENNLSFYNFHEHEGELRNLIVRNDRKGNWMIILAITDLNEKTTALLEIIRDTFPQITSLQYVINTKKNDSLNDLEPVVFNGKDALYETFDSKNGPIKFKISSKSFFQTNPEQAENLYRLVYDYVNPNENQVVYDLYTGIGSIALFMAKALKHIVGIEYVEEAIADAEINMELNDIENASFYAGDMKDVFNEVLIKKHGLPDVVITDPPRAGMHEDVVKTIMKANPKKIVYVSCNPATQARDIAWMSDQYNVLISQAVDMFPRTSHVENIVVLERKND